MTTYCRTQRLNHQTLGVKGPSGNDFAHLSHQVKEALADFTEIAADRTNLKLTATDWLVPPERVRKYRRSLQMHWSAYLRVRACMLEALVLAQDAVDDLDSKVT